ncbi:serine/threonine protein kinase, partial [Streptomyces sp. NPDC051098]
TAARLLAAAGADTGTASTASPAPREAGPQPVTRVPTVLDAAAQRPGGFGPAASEPAVPAVTPPAAPQGSRPAPAFRGHGRMTLIAAGVAAVLLAGGGVTYALVDRGGSSTADLAGGDGTSPSTSAREESASGKALAPGEKSPSSGPSEPEAGTSPSKSAEAPAAGTNGAGESTGGSSGKGGAAGSGDTTGGGATTGGGGSDASGGGSGSATGGGATTGGGSDPSPAPVCHAIGGGKYNCKVWRTATSYTASGTEKGVLKAGTNYFYCQQNLGRRATHGQWTNVWWARTDDDSGNTGVFVNDVNIQGGKNDEPVPGLPVC